jgi:hypothetical protein
MDHPQFPGDELICSQSSVIKPGAGISGLHEFPKETADTKQ